MRVLSGRRKVAIEMQLVSVRYCPDVNYYFRVSGADWQARMNAVRKEYVEVHSTGNARRA